MASEIEYTIEPWKKAHNEDKHIALKTIYIKLVKDKNGQPVIEYKLKVPPEKTVYGCITEKDSRIPLARQLRSPLPDADKVEFIRKNYKEKILAYTNKKGHTLGKNNNRWFYNLIIASATAVGAAFLAFYAVAKFSATVIELFLSLSASAFAAVASSIAGLGIGIGFIAIGSWLLFKERDCQNKSQILEGSLISSLGWSGFGASLGALLGTFVFPGLGTALGAAFGGGIGLGISLILIGTAVTLDLCMIGRWPKMIAKGDNLNQPDDYELNQISTSKNTADSSSSEASYGKLFEDDKGKDKEKKRNEDDNDLLVESSEKPFAIFK